MEAINEWWGINEKINILEIGSRAGAMFFIVVVIIRLSGMRTFRSNSALDMVMAFLVGGILSRGVVGATPFFSTISGAVVLIFLHKIFSKISFASKRFERLTKGEKYLIYKDGKFIWDNMRLTNVTKLEVYEDLRADLNTDSLDEIAEAFVEKTGEISFVKKDKKE